MFLLAIDRHVLWCVCVYIIAGEMDYEDDVLGAAEYQRNMSRLMELVAELLKVIREIMEVIEHM